MKILATVSALALTMTVAARAEATPLAYTLSGLDIDGTVEFASFVLDSNPLILPNNVGVGQGFRIKFVSGIFQYGSTISNLQDLEFGNAAVGGGFLNLDPADQTGDSAFLFTVGPQLYSGPESTPTLLTGDFTVFDYFSGAPLSLKVTAVPEPATWGLLILGFGAIGGSLRSSKAARKLSVSVGPTKLGNT